MITILSYPEAFFKWQLLVFYFILYICEIDHPVPYLYLKNITH